MKTEVELLNDYLEFKPRMLAGNVTASDMTDEQQAGCMIRNAGSAEDGLQVVESMSAPIKTAYLTKWPRVILILEEAKKLAIEGVK